MISNGLYGPGSAGEYSQQRKIIKGETYKNWRLDGEAIYDPPDHPGRFSALKQADLAVFEFVGYSYPVSAKMVLLAADSDQDSAAHSVIAARMAGRPMISLTAEDLGRLIPSADIPDDHSVYELLLDDALEDAVQGGSGGSHEPPREQRRLHSVRGWSHEQTRQGGAGAAGAHGADGPGARRGVCVRVGCYDFDRRHAGCWTRSLAAVAAPGE
jgi:hypothetical protein